MSMKTITLGFLGLVLGAGSAVAAYQHVVVVEEENRDYTDFIGNTASAPYINSVLVPQGTVLTNSLAIGHPSEPNYLQLFSGSAQATQGTDGPVAGSQAPAGAPSTGTGLNAPNLGATTRSMGGTYATYSENLSSASDPLAYQAGGASGALYARKHNPGSDFISFTPTGNQLAASTNQDFSAFPKTAAAFSNLPTLSFVIPNQCNDAHGTTDCPNSGAGYQTNIGLADTWLKNNLDAYAQWAKTHDSLLVVTTDEGNTTVGTDPATGLPLSRVATILVGQGISGGATYGGTVDEYGLCAFLAASVGAGGGAPANCGTTTSLGEAFALGTTLRLGSIIDLPEPGSLALMAAALMGFGLIRRRPN